MWKFDNYCREPIHKVLFFICYDIWGDYMGRKRIDPQEKKVTLSLNLKQKVIDAMKKDGIPKKIAEDIITKKYEKE